jgi:predicted HTH domain antitoxin
MTIELPDVNIGSQPLTSEQARVDFAVGLYTGRQVSLGRAAKVAGISYTDFMHELGKRGICLNYTIEDMEHDMRMADELAAKAAGA